MEAHLQHCSPFVTKMLMCFFVVVLLLCCVSAQFCVFPRNLLSSNASTLAKCPNCLIPCASAQWVRYRKGHFLAPGPNIAAELIGNRMGRNDCSSETEEETITERVEN